MSAWDGLTYAEGEMLAEELRDAGRVAEDEIKAAESVSVEFARRAVVCLVVANDLRGGLSFARLSVAAERVAEQRRVARVGKLARMSVKALEASNLDPLVYVPGQSRRVRRSQLTERQAKRRRGFTVKM